MDPDQTQGSGTPCVTGSTRTPGAFESVRLSLAVTPLLSLYHQAKLNQGVEIRYHNCTSFYP